MGWTNQDQYFSGQGVVMLAKRNTDGTPQAFYPIGNCPELSIGIDVSTETHKESKSGQRATDLRITTETELSMSMTIENFNNANLARVLRGATTEIASGSVTDEAITAYEGGGVTALAHVKVSALSITTTDGLTTLTAYVNDATPWDYKVNLEAGSVQFNPTSGTRANAVADFTVSGFTYHADYSYAAQDKIDAMTEAQEELYMRFEGLNTVGGNEPVVVEVFKVTPDPLQELSLISDEVQSFVLEGSVLADGTKSVGSQFFRVLKTGG